jgi:hypothetical protein
MVVVQLSSYTEIMWANDMVESIIVCFIFVLGEFAIYRLLSRVASSANARWYIFVVDIVCVATLATLFRASQSDSFEMWLYILAFLYFCFITYIRREYFARKSEWN